MHGRSETGISLMQMDEGMDTGPVYAIRKIPIGASTNAGQLTAELAALAADMVRHELLAVLDGQSTPVPQEHRLASPAPPIGREHASINWGKSNVDIVNQVRALAPVPGAFSFAGGRRLKVLEASLLSNETRGRPGEVLDAGATSIEVACGIGSLALLRAQPEGKNPQGARDLVNGRVLERGQRLERIP
jgi:methionyl-tRNA formyltransferase